MKTKQNMSGWLAVLGLCFSVVATQATLPVIPLNEVPVVFADDFDNGNVNGWTGIGTGIGQATISGGTWSPSNSGDTSATSDYTFAQPLDLTANPFAVYMRVRVDNTNGNFANAPSIGLIGSDASHLGVLQVRPQTSPFQNYGIFNLHPGPNWHWHYFTGPSWPDTSTFMDFRLLFQDNGNGSMTLSAFYYDTGASQYNLVGSISDAGSDTSNMLSTLRIQGNAVFDSVAVTAIIPEPSIGLLLLTGFGLWRWKRAAKK